MLTAAGIDSRVVIDVLDSIQLPLSHLPQREARFWKDREAKGKRLQKAYDRFITAHQRLCLIPKIETLFGKLPTNADTMLWLREKFASGSSILISQGDLPDSPVKNGIQQKAAPCWTLEEVLAGARKVRTGVLGGFYISNVFHEDIREDRWKHPAFIGSCTRTCNDKSDTRWLKFETYYVWCDAETKRNGKRVPPTPEQLATLLKYCRDRGATAVCLSPHGMHVLLIFTRLVPVTSPKPMRAVVEWFFRDFAVFPASEWHLDITACATRTRLERVCPIVYWDKDAVVDVPAEVITSVAPLLPAKKTQSVKSNWEKTSGKFGSGGEAAAAGKKALGIRREALHYSGFDHVKTGAFIASVAATVGLKHHEVAALFKKYPVTGESFGALDVAASARDIMPMAPECAQQRTKKLYASLGWGYTIIYSRTGCTTMELHTLFSSLLVRPLIPASAVIPPEGPEMPSHILLPKTRPQPLYEQAVLAAFGVTKACLVNTTNPQVIKALAALELAAADPKLENRLCDLLDRASALMLGEDFLAWLKKDIARCAKKFWGANRRLASKRRIRLVLLALAKLPNPENFTTSDLLALIKSKICHYGFKKLSKAERADLKADKAAGKKAQRKKQVKKPRKKNITQAIYRVLAELQKDGLVARHDYGEAGINNVGRSAARWGITALAVESGKWVKPNKIGVRGQSKECFTHNTAGGRDGRTSFAVPKIGSGRSVTLKPTLELGQWFVGALNHGKGLMIDRLPMLVHGIRGYIDRSGVPRWQLEGFASVNSFGWSRDRFACDVLATGLIKVRELHIAQFNCPTLIVPDGIGGQRELGAEESYSGAFLSLEIGLKTNESYTRAWFQAKPVRYDASTGKFTSTETVQTQPGLLTELNQMAVKAWQAKQRFIAEKLAGKNKTFAKINETKTVARTTQNLDLRAFLEERASVIIGRYYNNVPEGIARWAAENWNTLIPEIEMGRLLGGLQKIHRQRATKAENLRAHAKN